MILNLVHDGHPILMQEAPEFDFNDPPCDPVELANNLIETMVANKGIGLAAPQVGLPYRVFALYSADPIVVFNPRIVDQTSELVPLEEGCLTYPNLVINIKRPRAIKARFQNAFGDTFTEKFIGMTARGFLHELDHLDGIMFTKRATTPHLMRAWNQKKQLDRKIKRGEVVYKPSTIPNVTLG